MSQAHTLPCGHVYDVVPSWGCQKCAAGLPPDPKPVAATIQSSPSSAGEKSEVESPKDCQHAWVGQTLGSEVVFVCIHCKAEHRESRPDDSHYARLTPQPIAVIMAWGLTFTLGNVVKYIARAGHKKGSSALSDLKKARRYIDYEIERIEGEE